MPSKHRFHAMLVALLAALLLTTVAGAAPKGGASVDLSVEQGAFDSSQEVFVTVTISNPTNQPVKVLKWFTPVAGVEEPLFAVTRDGQPVEYIGPLYKRAAATEQDYISLNSGESISSTVNLGEYYDLSVSGQYEIAYAVASFHLYSEKGNALKSKEVLTSEKVSVGVDAQFKATRTPRPATATPSAPTATPGSGGGGKPTRTPSGTNPTATPTSGGGGGIGFTSCNATQQNTLTTAHVNAQTYASSSENYLYGISSGTARYTEWFGAFTTSRFNLVKAHFTSISNAFDTAPVVYDCSCTQSYYAYVYPNQPYKIYLCNAFWTAPMTGTDSKAGTLIHEMSHFTIVADTDDFVYGQTAARNLAINNPDNAVRNADNHEYFAENTPTLP
jgi:peptidyl-Lys metalloendopeptidase